ncbi:hypothetical protein F4823DRAFT_583113 [Ustulina deusta]|nr:hypothetical protein F4823DRAFT_583113 [Ustulina deusta]
MVSFRFMASLEAATQKLLVYRLSVSRSRLCDVLSSLRTTRVYKERVQLFTLQLSGLAIAQPCFGYLPIPLHRRGATWIFFFGTAYAVCPALVFLLQCGVHTDIYTHRCYHGTCGAASGDSEPCNARRRQHSGSFSVAFLLACDGKGCIINPLPPLCSRRMRFFFVRSTTHASP